MNYSAEIEIVSVVGCKRIRFYCEKIVAILELFEKPETDIYYIQKYTWCVHLTMNCELSTFDFRFFC